MIIKAWTHKLAGSSKDGSTRKVFLNSLGKSLPLLGVWAGIKIGVYFISLGEAGGLAETVVFTGLEVLLVVAVALLAYYLVEVPSSWLTRQTEKTESKFDDMLVPIVRKSLRVTVVLFAVVSIAQSLSDKPISALIAGLGLGGLAFALAAQDTIKNLLVPWSFSQISLSGWVIGLIMMAMTVPSRKWAYAQPDCVGWMAIR